MYHCVFGRNVLAPIGPRPKLIVDVGTGSGRWVIEVANQYESATVIGLDLSPAEPLYEIPDNAEFLVGDLTQGLDFDDGSLDLVHSR
jgi:ubiquinone/menaquinone biosynthesis C-methylase UbiE